MIILQKINTLSQVCSEDVHIPKLVKQTFMNTDIIKDHKTIA